MDENKKIAAVCLAAGQGKRMESKVQKQYLLIEDKPVLYYALKAFQACFYAVYWISVIFQRVFLTKHLKFGFDLHHCAFVIGHQSNKCM